MLRRAAACFVPLALLSLPAQADDDRVNIVTTTMNERPAQGVGVGLVLGEPTGLTLAVRETRHAAFQGYATWSVVHDRARFSVDWIPTLALFEGTSVDVPLYIGLGGIVSIDENDPLVGVRVPIGVSLLPRTVPLEPFVEVAPVVGLVPEPEPGLEGVLGLRFYL